MNIARLVAILLTFILLSACSTSSNLEGRSDQPYTAKQLFVTGEQALARGDYSTAIKQFDAINAQYPYGKYAQQAQLDIIYAHYESDDFVSAAVAAEHFIHLYPRAKHVDYAYYMLGVANFEQQRGFLTKFLPMDNSLRDTGASIEAYNNFKTLISYFPRSSYVADAKQRMIYLRNLFAQKELHAANYYYERGSFVAAANRASFIVQTYPQAPQVEQALVLLVNANRHLRLQKPANDALLVLKANYPESYKLFENAA